MSFYLLNELEVAQIIKREEVENYWKDKDEINGYKLGKEDEKTLMLDDERRLSNMHIPK